MQGSITENQLLRYIYRETTDGENSSIGDALMLDSYLQETYRELQLAIRRLPRMRRSPSPASLQRILSYSRKVPT